MTTQAQLPFPRAPIRSLDDEELTARMEPFDSFWCCVGTGMESHAKHGDSVYWESDDTLYVNLYVASTAMSARLGAAVALETDYPFGDRVTLRVEARDGNSPFDLALRLTDAESDHLHVLAGTAPNRAGLHRRDVRPSILALLQRLPQTAAFVVSATFEVLAWND